VHFGMLGLVVEKANPNYWRVLQVPTTKLPEICVYCQAFRFLRKVQSVAGRSFRLEVANFELQLLILFQCLVRAKQHVFTGSMGSLAPSWSMLKQAWSKGVEKKIPCLLEVLRFISCD
jgi:hypothetical protein